MVASKLWTCFNGETATTCDILGLLQGSTLELELWLLYSPLSWSSLSVLILAPVKAPAGCFLFSHESWAGVSRVAIVTVI